MQNCNEYHGNINCGHIGCGSKCDYDLFELDQLHTNNVQDRYNKSSQFCMESKR